MPPAATSLQLMARERFLASLNPYVLTQDGKSHIDKLRLQSSQARERMRDNSAEYRYQQVNTKLSSIQEDTQRLVKSQSDIFKIQAIALNYQTEGIDHIKAEVGEQTDALKTIQEQLSKHGIAVNAQFWQLCGNQEALKGAMAEVLTYIDEERDIRRKQQEQAESLARYQGLTDACELVMAAGQLTNCRVLGDVGFLVQSGVKITQLTQQVLAQSLGVAALSPMSAIGMIALSIFSHFFGDKQVNYNQIILQQLQQLSKQVSHLQKTVEQGFKDVRQDLQDILNYTARAFRNLYYSLQLPTERSLKAIELDLAKLMAITQQGFEDILLHKLEQPCFTVKSLLQETITLQAINPGKTLHRLAFWISNQSYKSTFNGYHLVRFIEDPRQVVETLGACDEDRLSNLLGFLAYDMQQRLKNPALKPQKMAQPFIWHKAIKYYLALLHYCRSEAIPLARHKDREIRSFIAKAQPMTLFFQTLQTNETLYLQITNDLKKSIQALQSHYKQLLSKQDVTILVPGSLELDRPQHPEIEFKQPIEEGRDGNRFVSLDVIYQKRPRNVINFLIEKEIVFPIEFLLAEHFKLGYFDMVMHQSVSDGKRQWAKTSNPPRYGFDINFIIPKQTIKEKTIKEQSICLYRAKEGCAKWKRETQGVHKSILGWVYINNIKNFTDRVYGESELMTIRNLLEMYLNQERSAIARECISILECSELYYAVLKQQALLVAYLTVAGFPDDNINAAKNLICAKDIFAPLNEVAKNTGSLPDILQLPTEEDIDKLSKNISTAIDKAQATDFESFQNHILGAFRHGMSMLQQERIAQLVLPKSNKVEVKKYYELRQTTRSSQAGSEPLKPNEKGKEKVLRYHP